MQPSNGGGEAGPDWSYKEGERGVSVPSRGRRRLRQCLPSLQVVDGHIEDASHGAGVIGAFNEIVLVTTVNDFNDTTVMDVFQSPPCGLTQVTAWWQRTGKTRPSPSNSPPQVWGTTTRGSDIPGRAPRERWAQRSRGQQSQPAGQ